MREPELSNAWAIDRDKTLCGKATEEGSLGIR